MSNIVIDDMARLGYNSMILKADNEISLQKVLAKEMEGSKAKNPNVRVMEEELPTYESQSTGKLMLELWSFDVSSEPSDFALGPEW